MDILNIDLNCINLDEDDSGTIIHVRLLAWRTKFEKLKTLLKELNEELMSVLCHPNRWWDRCVSENEKKETDSMFIIICVGSIQYGDIETFC